jgi:CheY-like chemotaxis protein
MSGAMSQSRFTVLLPIEQEGWHETLTQLLKPQGVHMVLARSGREALELIEGTPVHAAVLDMGMAGLGGLQVVKLMREIHGRTAPPAILLTEQLTNHLLREALTMQVFSVVAKPVDFNLLLDALARLLRRYHENRWPGEG